MKISKKSPETLWKESLDDVSYCINKYEYAKHYAQDYLKPYSTVSSWAMEDFINRVKELRIALSRCERMFNNIKEIEK